VIWHVSHRADWRALPIADRHYNRQKPGAARELFGEFAYLNFPEVSNV
jgi:hypothetical protein